MNEPSDHQKKPWTASPTAKEKNAVQRAVTALLDELAPERVLKRVESAKGSVEQHRTPTGCVLQAPTAAVSVSWFVDADTPTDLGELQIVVWRGTVTRRGVRHKPGAATLVSEHALHPVPNPADDRVWQATDGTRYDSPGLAAYCAALLEEQTRAAP
jgi:hypothetical protein